MGVGALPVLKSKLLGGQLPRHREARAAAGSCAEAQAAKWPVDVARALALERLHGPGWCLRQRLHHNGNACTLLHVPACRPRWHAAQFDPHDTEQYLSAMASSLEHRNAWSDIRFAGAADWRGVIQVGVGLAEGLCMFFVQGPAPLTGWPGQLRPTGAQFVGTVKNMGGPRGLSC